MNIRKRRPPRDISPSQCLHDDEQGKVRRRRHLQRLCQVQGWQTAKPVSCSSMRSSRTCKDFCCSTAWIIRNAAMRTRQHC